MRARAVGRTHAGPGAVQAASRQRGSRSSNQEPPAGRPDSNHRTRQGQRTTSGSGTGSQRQHQRQRPGRRSHQTRPRPRPPARSRNARACERYCWAAGQALRVRKRKIFLGKGSKMRQTGANEQARHKKSPMGYAMDSTRGKRIRNYFEKHFYFATKCDIIQRPNQSE